MRRLTRLMPGTLVIRHVIISLTGENRAVPRAAARDARHRRDARREPARRGPDAAVRAGCVRRRTGDDRRRRVRDLQLCYDRDTDRCSDDNGFFNYTDYEHSALRMLRVGVTAAVKAGRTSIGPRRAAQRERRAPRNRTRVVLSGIRPWTSRAFDVQVGRVPPTFGAFARRTYPADNLVIGYPLAYQYLTSLRPDALPADADELLRMRGRGWLSNFSVGNTGAGSRAGRSSARFGGTPASRCMPRTISSTAPRR